MTPKHLQLTDAEFAVLNGLWKRGPQTIRELTERLYPKCSSSDYATVQKLLDRLEAKNCVTRDRSQLAHKFRAAKDRGDLIDAQLQQMANRLCDGSMTPVLMHLVKVGKLSKRDRKALQTLLAEAESTRRKRGAK